MEFIYLDFDLIRPKSLAKIRQYLDLSKYNRLKIGLYKNGKCYVFGDASEMELFYDIGSITKTVTAHIYTKCAILTAKAYKTGESCEKNTNRLITHVNTAIGG